MSTKKLLDEINLNKKENIVVVAPTSYGKSELIVEKVLLNLNKKICILVPSKALLAQTKKRLINNEKIFKHFKKIVTHPELYSSADTNVLAVLTQERLQLILNKFPNDSFDLVLIDEAHNVFVDDERAILLCQVLLILKKRNRGVNFNFFSPFIYNTDNLKIRHLTLSFHSEKISEQLKTEKFYIYYGNNRKTQNKGELNKKLVLFDQYLNTSFDLTVEQNYLDNYDFIIKNSGKKNIIYINSPVKTENFSLRFIKKLPLLEKIKESPEYIAIKNYIHKDYYLLKCIERGVVYHHASMPDIIKLYVEKIFSEDKNFKYIITTSTLLEGVNIPADKMFLLDLYKGRSLFTSSMFKNLIGRVCRFKEIFDNENGNLKYLMPEIYIVQDPIGRNTNIIKFLKKVLNLSEENDNVKNVLLENCRINDSNQQHLKKAEEYIANLEPGTISIPLFAPVTSTIGKLCFRYNIHDFDIKANESILNENYKLLSENTKISDEQTLLETLNYLFFTKIKLIDNNIKRLQNQKARLFYKWFLQEWKTKKPYGSFISFFLSYWKSIQFSENNIVYVGQKWGKIKKYDNDKMALYIDLSKESDISLINIAILRVKEEQDFIENNLLKYIEVLHDLDLLEESFYLSIKYGTTDPFVICLLKNGFSIELTKCITKKQYVQYLKLDSENNIILHIDSELINIMEKNNENPILLFELKYYCK